MLLTNKLGGIAMNETQDRIAQTFVELLKTRPYSKISIKNICESTPTSRNAFYYYFESKEALVKWIAIQHFLKYCFPFIKIRENNLSTKAFFNYILDYKSFYSAIYQYDGGELLRKCLMAAYNVSLDPEHVKEYAKNVVKDKNRIDSRVCLRYSNAGTAEVILFWISDGMRIPVEIIARDLMLMLTKSLEDVRDYYLY